MTLGSHALSHRRFAGWSSSRRRVSGPRHRTPDPCPHRGHRPADRWDRHRETGAGGPPGPHFYNWIRVSAEIEIFDFAELARVAELLGRCGQSRIIPTPPQLAAWSGAGVGQATKGTRRMPWRQEPMKDVSGCEKLRGAASRHRSGDVRMGKPGWRSPAHPWLNQIGQVEVSRRTE